MVELEHQPDQSCTDGVSFEAAVKLSKCFTVIHSVDYETEYLSARGSEDNDRFFFFTSCSFKVMTVAQSSRDSNRLNPHDDLLTTTADDQKKYVKSANAVHCVALLCYTTATS